MLVVRYSTKKGGRKATSTEDNSAVQYRGLVNDNEDDAHEQKALKD